MNGIIWTQSSTLGCKDLTCYPTEVKPHFLVRVVALVICCGSPILGLPCPSFCRMPARFRSNRRGCCHSESQGGHLGLPSRPCPTTQQSAAEEVGTCPSRARRCAWPSLSTWGLFFPLSMEVAKLGQGGWAVVERSFPQNGACWGGAIRPRAPGTWMLLLPNPVLAAEALGSTFIPGSDSAFFPA